MQFGRVGNYIYPVTPAQVEQEGAGGKTEEVTLILQALLSDIITVVFANMNFPMQIAFSWTCRTYCRLYFKPEHFNRNKFLDKCAKLGYRKLLAESIEDGMRVDFAMIYKAAHYGFSYAELWVPFLHEAHFRMKHEEVEKMYTDPIRFAARGRHLGLSAALAQCSRHVRGKPPAVDECYANGDVHLQPQDLIFYLSEGGHLDLAEIVFANLSDHQRVSLPRDRFIQIVFEGAANSGRLPLVKWCIAQSADLLAREVIICVENDGRRSTSNLDFLMVCGMRYGIVEFCRLAKNGGWQRSDTCPISHLKYVVLRWAKYNPSSNYLACVQYLDAEYEDTNKIEYLEDDVDACLPHWADLEGLSWLYENGYMSQLEDHFVRYCGLHNDWLKAILHSKMSIDQLVGWFIDRGVKVTPDAYSNAISEHRIDLLNILYKRDQEALPDNALESLIVGETHILKTGVLWFHFYFQYEDRGGRVCPFKITKSLLRTVHWLLQKGFKLEGQQRQCDELALTLMRIDRRAAQMFCSDAAIKDYLSEERFNLVFHREEREAIAL